jgi:hypothetical protein
MTQAQFAQTTAEMTRTEALTLALKLAVQAPTQAESDLAVATATHLAAGMSDGDIAKAKKAATASIRRGGVKQ